MRQVIYQSTAAQLSAAALAPAILGGARSFNGVNGITGLLVAARDQFLQVLEGPEDSVELAMGRILADPRHRDVDVLAARKVEARAFADWAMAYRDAGHPADLLSERVRVLIRGAPRDIGDRFRQFDAA